MVWLTKIMGFFTNIKNVLILAMLILFGYFYYNYNSLQKAIKIEKEETKRLEVLLKQVNDINKENQEVFKDIKKEYKKALAMVKRTNEYSQKVFKEKEKLLREAKAFRGKKLTKREIEVIRLLYPKANK